MTDVPAIRSPKYSFVTRLRRVQRRDLIWVGADSCSKWVIIPQQFSNLRPHAGEHCLVHDRSLVCRLRDGQGYRNDRVLIGRDGAGSDWLVCPKDEADLWALFRRDGGSGAATSRLPDAFLAGETSGTGVERLVAAALVLAGAAFQTSSDLPGRPDFVVPDRKLAVFSHGCHHHAHDCGLGRGYGQQLTRDEALEIRGYDARVIASLNDLGWRVLTIWECATDLGGNAGLAPQEFLARLAGALNSSEAAMTITGL